MAKPRLQTMPDRTRRLQLIDDDVTTVLRKRQALADQRREHHPEGQEDHEVALREGAGRRLRLIHVHLLGRHSGLGIDLNGAYREGCRELDLLAMPALARGSSLPTLPARAGARMPRLRGGPCVIARARLRGTGRSTRERSRMLGLRRGG